MGVWNEKERGEKGRLELEERVEGRDENGAAREDQAQGNASHDGLDQGAEKSEEEESE
jgi:hypothetical protein